MLDKIALLMEETGCDRGEAELALEMCGFEVEAAVKAVPRLLRNVAVLKGKFIHPEQVQFGLFLVILNIKSQTLLRARAVVSYNPAVYEASLDKDWFEFEKVLYGCRLWEGSLQSESLEIEQILSGHFRGKGLAELETLDSEPVERTSGEIAALLKGRFPGQSFRLTLRKDILNLGQFQSLRAEAEGGGQGRRSPARGLPRADELLVLKVRLEEDPRGIAAADLRSGDMVSARIVDARDIAQYLSRIFGGHSEEGPVPILAPVEAVESVPPTEVLVRARFSTGVCGDATVGRDSRVKAVRVMVRNQENLSWWRRIFKA